MKNIFGVILTVLIATMFLTSCHGISVNGGEEAVIVRKPLFFGNVGVDPVPITDGREWAVFSTDEFIFDVKPVQYTENFTDIITKDNNPVDFHGYIKLQINEGKSAELYDKFGIDWYVNNLQQDFRKTNRNLSSEQKLFDLTSDRSIVDNMETILLKHMQDLIVRLEMPVQALDVHVGKVVPPLSVLVETEKTAAQEQRILTLKATEQAELGRKASETARSDADNAYKNGMGFNNNQYLRYRDIQVNLEQIEMCKNKDNIKVNLITGSSGQIQPVVPLN